MNSIEEMRKGLKCLYLEVDASIADDLKKRFEAVLQSQQSEIPIEWEKKFAELKASHIMEVQGFLELNRKLGEEIAALKGNGSDAVEFKNWCDSGKAWFFDVQEDHTHTTEELYKLYKRSKHG